MILFPNLEQTKQITNAMSASSREEFEKRQRMIPSVSGLDDDTSMTSPPVESADSIQRLGRPIPQLPEHLGLTNLQSPLFRPTAAVLTLAATFMDAKSQDLVTRTCKRALLFKPSLAEGLAQHLVNGNFLKADALFKKTRQDKKALLDCIVEVTDHRKRKIKQRLFEILCMLGTRRANNQDIDLVEAWGSYLSPGKVKGAAKRSC